MRIELWSGTGDSHGLIGYADIDLTHEFMPKEVRLSDGRVFRGEVGNHRYTEFEMPTVTLIEPDSGPTPGNWIPDSEKAK